jgi:Flp pilus assembly pilin Flp
MSERLERFAQIVVGAAAITVGVVVSLIAIAALIVGLVVLGGVIQGVV